MRIVVVTCDLCHNGMDYFSKDNGSIMLYRGSAQLIGYQEMCPKCTDVMYKAIAEAVKERGKDVKQKS